MKLTALERIDDAIVYLTLERQNLPIKEQSLWEDINDAIWILKGLRKDIVKEQNENQ